MSSHSTRMAYLGSRSSPSGAGLSTWERLRAMIQARQTRRLLAGMDDHSLADIGLGRGDAMMEAARPMWDVAQARR